MALGACERISSSSAVLPSRSSEGKAVQLVLDQPRPTVVQPAATLCDQMTSLGSSRWRISQLAR